MRVRPCQCLVVMISRGLHGNTLQGDQLCRLEVSTERPRLGRLLRRLAGGLLLMKHLGDLLELGHVLLYQQLTTAV